MRTLAWAAVMIVALSLSIQGAMAQSSEASASEEETLYNGFLSIHYQCSGSEDFGPSFYPGVAVGLSGTDYGCQLNSPSGSTKSGYSTEGDSVEVNQYLPISASGEWNYYANFWIHFYPCDPEEDDCGSNSNGDPYPYIDPYGFTDYANDPTLCPINEECYGKYSDDSDPTGYDAIVYAYAGGTQPYNFGTFYVDALAIGISPASEVAYSGESVTFTAEVSNNDGYIPSYQWTLVSGPGSPSSGSGESFTYTAPPEVTASSTAVIKGCVINLSVTPICQTVAVDLIAETLSVSTPNPSVLFADGSSQSSLQAYINGGPGNASVTWTPAPQITMTGAATATYTAPTSAVAFPPGSTSPISTVGITATIAGSSPQIPASTTLTLVQPVAVTTGSGFPASLAAGSTTTITIPGGGFGASPSVSLSSSWPGVTFTQTSATNNAIVGTLAIPLNTQNVTASQGIMFTVSATNAGLTSSATSSAINITFASYTYTLTLTSTAPTLTYGSMAAITPHVACKTSTGAACPSGVPNPQTANFSLISGVGSLSATSNAASTNYTASTMVGTPQTATVQACATVATSVCTTVPLSITATTVTLSPGSVPGPLTAGKTQGFSATIQNPGIANQLTWTLTPTGAAAGTLTSATTAITGSPTAGISGTTTSPANTYTAPNPITTPESVTLRVCMSVNALICATPVTIQLPGFSVTATQIGSATGLSLGHSIRYTIVVTALDGFTGTVTLSVGGLPAGVTPTFSTQSIATSGTATLTLTSAYGASTYLGSSTVTVSGVSNGYPTPPPAAIALTTRALQYPCVTH